ncbi:MAG: hypothetical protein U5J95_08335 [Balneolaceae bacterium]|nr:hypothetical protein [Balneolaceae bacterium]
MKVKKEGADFVYAFGILNKSGSRQDIMSFELEIEDQYSKINLSEPWFILDKGKNSFVRFMHRGESNSNWKDDELIEIKYNEDIKRGDTLTFEIKSSNPLANVFQLILLEDLKK